MPHHRVRFVNSDGQTLAGILDAPDDRPRAYALFAHCFTCSKNLKAVAHIARALNQAGIAVLRFDFTGLGESEGEFPDTTFSSNVSDLVAAADYLEREHRAPALVIGHSLGGSAMLKAAAGIPSAVAVATIGAPSDPAQVIERFGEALSEIEAKGQAVVKLAGRPFTIKRSFLEDLERHPLADSISGLEKALLILHSPRDEIVEIDNAGDLFRHGRHPKSFISLSDADHLLTRETDSRYAGHVIAAWAEKYLFPSGEPRQALSVASGEVAARTDTGGLKTELNAAGHRFIADEPEDYGGTGLGPTPYDLLAAALASCTTMTLRMYAERKKLDLQAATARVRHSKVHARDCADYEGDEGWIDEFNRTILLEGNLPEAARARLLEIANRCPVHKTLYGTIRVRTKLDDGGRG